VEYQIKFRIRIIHKKTILFTTVFLLFLLMSVSSLSSEKVKITDKHEPLAFIYGENGTITYNPDEIYSDDNTHAVFYPKEDGTIGSVVIGAGNKKAVKSLLLKET